MTSITINIRPRGPDTFGITSAGFTVYTLNNSRVNALKTDIQDLRDIPIASQLLWLGNNKLADNTVQLQVAGIADGSTVYLQDVDYYRIYYYRPSAAAREETYVKGTQTLSAVMANLGMPNNRHSVNINGSLLQGGAPTYDRTLISLNITEDTELRFNLDSTNG